MKHRNVLLVTFLVVLNHSLLAQLYAPEIKIEDTGQGSPIKIDGKLFVKSNSTAPGESAGLVYNGEDFLWNARYLNQFSFGYHHYLHEENGISKLQVNPYISGFYGIDFFTQSTHAMRIKRNGMVGIGYTNPVYKLHVNGGIVSSNVSIGSDERIKKDIQDYSSGLDLVKSMNIKKYKYKSSKEMKTDIQKFNKEDESLDAEEDKFYNQVQIGVLAQDIQKIAPELVGSFIDNDGEETLTVNFTSFTFLLVNAVKEQQAMIEQLQQEIMILKEKKD
jgi:hypothetical protein